MGDKQKEWGRKNYKNLNISRTNATVADLSNMHVLLLVSKIYPTLNKYLLGNHGVMNQVALCLQEMKNTKKYERKTETRRRNKISFVTWLGEEQQKFHRNP